MAKSIRAISVFLASPGGLDYERSLFREEVQAYNEDSGYSDGVCFVPVGWELRASGIGRPQAQINEDLVECDFMIMMLWDRWGSPTDVGTGSYTAGVEEEYAVSADALRDPTRPMRDIAVLFKGVDPRQMSDPGPQLESVLGFRQRLEREKSLLFSVFDNELELRREIRKLLLRWTRADFDRPKSVDRTVPIARVAAANAVPSAGGKTMSSGEALKHARSLASSGRVAEAEQQYSQILATSGPPEALAEYARFLRRAGRFAQARTVAERLLRSAEREGNYELMVEALALLGVISRKEGRQGEALSYLGRARSLVTSLDLEDSNAIRIAGYALDNYGHALRRVGDLDRAVEVFSESQVLRRSTTDHYGRAHSLNNLGTVQRERGLLDEAFESHTEALRLFRDLDDPLNVAVTISQLGSVAEERELFDVARQSYLEALEQAKALANIDAISINLGKLSRLSLKVGDVEGALQFASECLESNEHSGNEEGSAQGLLLMGRALLTQGDLARALDYLGQAHERYSDIDHMNGRLQSLLELAKLYAQEGDDRLAEQAIEEATLMVRADPSPYLVEALEQAEAVVAVARRRLDTV